MVFRLTRGVDARPCRYISGGQWQLHKGIDSEVLPSWVFSWTKGFSDGMAGIGTAPDEFFILSRNAWLGTASHGAALWSGDIGSNWDQLHLAVTAGQGVGLSGGWLSLVTCVFAADKAVWVTLAVCLWQACREIRQQTHRCERGVLHTPQAAEIGCSVPTSLLSLRCSSLDYRHRWLLWWEP